MKDINSLMNINKYMTFRNFFDFCFKLNYKEMLLIVHHVCLLIIKYFI